MILTVAPPPPREFNFLREPTSASTQYEDAILENHRKVASEALSRIEENRPGMPAYMRVETGKTAETIVRTASEWRADLIVVGSHGRKGLEKVFLGSVAEEIIKTAPCSVEVIRDCTHD